MLEEEAAGKGGRGIMPTLGRGAAIVCTMSLIVLLLVVPAAGFTTGGGAAGLNHRLRPMGVNCRYGRFVEARTRQLERQCGQTAMTATPQTKDETEIVSEALRQTIMVAAPAEDCFHVASDLDSYRQWCSQGGMKKVVVLERNEDGLASKVDMTAGKLGVDMLNTMAYSYQYPNQVMFNSISGDVMKKLNGRYVFKESESGTETEVAYELDVEFGFPLPAMVRTTICRAIMRTALNAFKSHTETLSREGSVYHCTQTLKR